MNDDCAQHKGSGDMRGHTIRIMRCIAAFASIALLGASAQADRARVEEALSNIMELERPGQMALATVWDGNKYVQCRRMIDLSLRCEAAGALMQPSLERVLSPERVARLAALGWRLDVRFGNYAQSFAAGVPASRIAGVILQALKEGYDADLTTLDVQTDWMKSVACPPRNGPTQNLAGMINDHPPGASGVVRGCAYQPERPLAANESSKSKLVQRSQQRPDQARKAQLMEQYGRRISGEIRRLRINSERRVFMVLDASPGYVQCAPSGPPPAGIYCEAQSAESWPALARILTPERVALLHAAGYADPGRSPNYGKTYPGPGTSDIAMAQELLAILHDVYGYDGVPQLIFRSEKRAR